MFDELTAKVKIFRIYPDVELPTKATAHSACFDFRAYLNPTNVSLVTKYASNGTKLETMVASEPVNNIDGMVWVSPGERIMIPTGIVFEIPPDLSIRIHNRSGLPLKRGLSLSHSTGIIDADYREEVFIPLTNYSSVNQCIRNSERLCQIEVVWNLKTHFEETPYRPEPYSDRVGGFGSTGVR